VPLEVTVSCSPAAVMKLVEEPSAVAFRMSGE